MADIKFARDYGYTPAAPFWLVWNEKLQSCTVSDALEAHSDTDKSSSTSIGLYC